MQAAAVLSSTLELSQVFDLILQQLQRVIAFDSASIQQLEHDELVIMAGRGFNDSGKIIGVRFPLISKFPNTRVLSERKPLAVADIAPEYPHFWDEADYYITGAVRSWLGLPLLSKERVIGMISFDRHQVRPFSREDIELATVFANQAALAIENARLYEQAQRHSAELEQRVKERTAQLEVVNEELLVLTRVKDEFVANVSHELRTPIANLMLRYYLLRKQPEQLFMTLPVLERETTRLARIIDDLLILSRMDQDRTLFALMPMDVNALAGQLVADRRLLAEERTLQLNTNFAPGKLMVLGDEGLLEQALSVLLTNALNYTPADGQILVSTQVIHDNSGRWAALSIHDTGPGISQEEQVMLFTRFFRGEVGQASQTPGTGLGLAIAREIVTRHQGHITVESGETTGGTTFTVWLPTAPD